MFINPDSLTGRSNNLLSGVARLKPNVTVAQAQRELNALTPSGAHGSHGGASSGVIASTSRLAAQTREGHARDI